MYIYIYIYLFTYIYIFETWLLLSAQLPSQHAIDGKGRRASLRGNRLLLFFWSLLRTQEELAWSPAPHLGCAGIPQGPLSAYQWQELTQAYSFNTNSTKPFSPTYLCTSHCQHLNSHHHLLAQAPPSHPMTEARVWDTLCLSKPCVYTACSPLTSNRFFWPQAMPWIIVSHGCMGAMLGCVMMEC